MTNNTIKFISIILFFIINAFFYKVFSQTTKLNVTIHARVDTTNKEVKEIDTLWINYLSSQPDSIYNNPYWNEEEKLKYKDFDLSRVYLYKFSSKQLLNYYKPTILSIEKEGLHYSIRTLFSADGLDSVYRKSNPWSITKLYAVKENNSWKLKNALSIVTEKWNRKSIGKITFIYSPNHLFNKSLAINANDFCTNLAKKFQFIDWKPFDFYITTSGDEMGKLINFDFYFPGYTTGMGMNNNRILLSGLDSEFYPHEFMHLIMPKFNRHAIIEEGFATWNGGARNKTFEQRANELAKELLKNKDLTFENVLTKNWHWHYDAGAILCKLTYDAGGLNALKKLLETPDNDDELFKTICTIFNIKKEEINSLWKKEVLKYSSK